MASASTSRAAIFARSSARRAAARPPSCASRPHQIDRRGAVPAAAPGARPAPRPGLWRAGVPHLGRSPRRGRPRAPPGSGDRAMTLSPGTRDRLIGLASPVLLLLLWEGCARLGWVDPRFFPAPSRIAANFVKLASTGELWTNLSASLARLFWGYLLGGIPALLLGLAMGLYRPIRAL